MLLTDAIFKVLINAVFGEDTASLAGKQYSVRMFDKGHKIEPA
jgi:hypothetical protein